MRGGYGVRSSTEGGKGVVDIAAGEYVIPPPPIGVFIRGTMMIAITVTVIDVGSMLALKRKCK
jgi:hypothetical protein